MECKGPHRSFILGHFLLIGGMNIVLVEYKGPRQGPHQLQPAYVRPNSCATGRGEAAAAKPAVRAAAEAFISMSETSPRGAREKYYSTRAIEGNVGVGWTSRIAWWVGLYYTSSKESVRTFGG